MDYRERVPSGASSARRALSPTARRERLPSGASSSLRASRSPAPAHHRCPSEHRRPSDRRSPPDRRPRASARRPSGRRRRASAAAAHPAGHDLQICGLDALRLLRWERLAALPHARLVLGVGEAVEDLGRPLVGLARRDHGAAQLVRDRLHLRHHLGRALAARHHRVDRLPDRRCTRIATGASATALAAGDEGEDQNERTWTSTWRAPGKKKGPCTRHEPNSKRDSERVSCRPRPTA